MRAPIFQCLAILLLLPAALGCCWHSALAGDRTAGLDYSACAEACEHACAHCGQPEAPVKHEKCKQQCKAHCFFLPTPKPQVEQTTSVLPLPMLPESMPLAGGTSLRGERNNLGCAFEFTPPLRLHAWNCTFLN